MNATHFLPHPVVDLASRFRWLTASWSRLLGRAHDRRHRFCDRRGNAIRLGTFLRNAPEALLTTLGEQLFGYRAALPWISCSARRELLRRMPRSSTVLELGSGASTVWLGRHFSRVYSVEDSPRWFAKVERRLRAERLDHIVYHQAADADDYVAFPHEDVLFDLVLIDGRYRGRCLDSVLGRLRPGAVVYLDDTDRDDPGDPRERLTRHVEEHGGELRRFVDFPANSFRVRQGLLAQFTA